jgi:MFS family permease
VVANLGGLSLYGWSFSAYMLANILGLILAGDEADRSGPALPFLCGASLFALGLILADSAFSMLIFVVSRGVQGLGSGILASVAYVCLGRGYPERLKPQMIAILSSAWVVPGLVGPALAGIVALALGWRWVFLGLVPVLPLAAFLIVPALKRLTASAAAQSWNLRRLLAALGLVIGSGHDPGWVAGTISPPDPRVDHRRSGYRDTIAPSHPPAWNAQSESRFASRNRYDGLAQPWFLWR